MKKYRPLAEDIIAHVGGKENITGLTHCITRLRFELKDQSKADDEYLKDRDGVVTIVKNPSQYMVVIGEHVGSVYEEVVDILGGGINDKENNEKVPLSKQILPFIMGTLAPIIFLLSASGIIKGILSILVMAGALNAESGIYTLGYAIGDGIFYFLPVLLGINVAKYIKMDILMGALIGAILCYPTINGVDLNFMGKVVNLTYTNSMLPVLVTVLFAGFVEKYVKKIIPEMIASFIVPMIVLIISVPAGFLILGQAANFVGDLVANGMNFVYGLSPILGATILGGLWQVLVMFGVHMAVVSVPIMKLAQGVPSEMMGALFGPSFAVMGITLGVYLKTKNQKMKEITMPAFISTIFGITEPSMYGLIIPRPTLFKLTIIAAAVSGLVGGIFRNTTYAMSGLGIFAAIGMISPEGGGLIGIAAQMIIPIIVGAILSFISYSDKNDPVVLKQKEKKETTEVSPVENLSDVEIKITSPVKGKVEDIKNSTDEVFSSEVLGKGVVIYPTEGKVFAPTDGVIKNIFDTKHAISFLSNDGAEILMHIGIDTVKLNGEGFKAYVKNGDAVKKGDLLIDFDIDLIKEKGFSPESLIVITNHDSYDEFNIVENKNVDINDEIISVKRGE